MKQDRLAQTLLAWLDDQPAQAPDVLLDRVLNDLRDLPQRRRWRTTLGRTILSPNLVRLAAAGLAIITVMAGVVLLSAFKGGTTAPSSSATPAVTQTALSSTPRTQFSWNPGAAERDWPGPIRSEPASGGDDVVPTRGGLEWSLDDPTGDAGSGAPDWIDIQEVLVPGLGHYWLRMSGPQPTIPDPARSWVAYGLVIDDDGDGIGDRRIGKDNAGCGPHQRSTSTCRALDLREWSTDLATGQTSVSEAPSIGGFPGREEADLAKFLSLREDDPLRSPRFYAWTALIQDGQIVATDYAPDSGWINYPTEAR